MVSSSKIHGKPKIPNLKQTEQLPKPIALVVYPASDWNGAFRKIEQRTYEFKRHGYQVVYVKCHSDQDMIDAIRRVGEKQPISVLYIAGHGTVDTTRFGGSGACELNEANCLDTKDGPKMAGLDRYLSQKATIIVRSCSTGKGGQDQLDNMANTLGRTFPGRQIYAPKHVSYSPKIEFQGQKIVDVQYPLYVERGESVDSKQYTEDTYVPASAYNTYKVPQPDKAHNPLLVRYLKGEDIKHPVTFGYDLTYSNGFDFAFGVQLRNTTELGPGYIDLGVQVATTTRRQGGFTLAPGIAASYRVPLGSKESRVAAVGKLSEGISMSYNDSASIASATAGIETSWKEMVLQVSGGAQCNTSLNDAATHCSPLVTLGLQSSLTTFLW